VGGYGLDSIESWQVPVAGCCEHDNELRVSYSYNVGNFLNRRATVSFLRRNVIEIHGVITLSCFIWGRVSQQVTDRGCSEQGSGRTM
jgi:hypothetical protein